MSGLGVFNMFFWLFICFFFYDGGHIKKIKLKMAFMIIFLFKYL